MRWLMTHQLLVRLSDGGETMTFFGFSIEDVAAFCTASGAFLGALVWLFRWAFRTEYKKISEDKQREFYRLKDIIGELKSAIDTLSKTVDVLSADTKVMDGTIGNHETRISILEEKYRKDD